MELCIAMHMWMEGKNNMSKKTKTCLNLVDMKVITMKKMITTYQGIDKN